MPFLLILTLIFNSFVNFGEISFSNSFSAPVKTQNKSLGVYVSAQSALAVDEKSGKILFSKEPDKVLPIASITKLVSALVLADSGVDWQKEVKIKKEDYKEGGRIYLGYGERVTLYDLLNLGLIASDNEAIAALVRGAGFTEEEFVVLMNKKARELGMRNSRFFDPTGLDPRNVSTVYDLAKLAKRVFSEKQLKEILNKKEYSFTELERKKNRKIFSTNKLFNSFLYDKESNYRLKAGKTGYLEEAGYCFLSKAEDNFGNSIIVAILGSKSDKSRFQETKALVWWVFNNWRWD